MSAARAGAPCLGRAPARRLALSRALLLVLAGSMASCAAGLHSNTPAAVSYVLRAVPEARASGPMRRSSRAGGSEEVAHPLDATLRVLRPLAGPGLDSDHIAIARTDHRLTWYAASRWAAPLPEVVEALAVESFRRAGGWRAVEDSRGVVSAGYVLQIGIRRFEADDAGAGPPLIHVALDCTLSRRDDRALVASFTVARDLRAEENRMGAVVAAFERAADQSLAEAAERVRAATARAIRASSGESAPSGTGPDEPAGAQKSARPVASISR